MRFLAFAVCLLLASGASAQTQVEVPKALGYGSLEGGQSAGAKALGYGSLEGGQAAAAKAVSFAVFDACIVAPKLIGYGVLESAENALRELILLRTAHAQWWPTMNSAGLASRPCH